MDFAAGDTVRARGLPWDLLEATPFGAQYRLRLRCASGDLRGLEWDFLYPNEPIEQLQSSLRPEAPGPLASWRLHHIACLLEQVPGSAEILATAPGRVTIEPFQLVPLMRALEMPRPRLLLADGVGLGKTIQAGLIATEMIARRRAHRVLVVSPAGPLLVQWEHELRQRFGLRFTPIVDASGLQRERRRIELGGNPFDSIALCLVSLDFAKQERVLEDLERSSWDLAIIDEAHHCVSAGSGADSDDTLRRRLAEIIARRCDGLLLLTATPHDGYDAHFASLIELLDPSLVDGRGGLAGMAYRRHVVRRLKSHIRHPETGEPLFRERQVVPVRIELRGRAARPVQDFHTALAALVAPRLQRAQRSGDFADVLAFVGLLKRSVSTIAACVSTLNVVAERYRGLRESGNDSEALRKERTRALRAWRRRRLRFGILDAVAEENAAALEAEDMAADLCSFGAAEQSMESRGVSNTRDEPDTILVALEELILLGVTAQQFDPKLNAVLDEVRLIRLAHPATNILIYTEYADSQAAALHALRHAAGIGGEVLAISGLDPEVERTRAAERCAEQDGIILVSTDSMAEGLNLHQRCFHLIHLDLPYNPNRLEQRNGRIDRYGQRRAPEMRYLYLAGTFEERLLLRLIAKYEKARARLDVMPDTLGVTADEAAWSTGLLAGFAEDQAALFEDAAPAIRTLDQAAQAGDASALRDLLREIDRAFAGHERHSVRHGWLAEQGFDADLGQIAAADAARQHSDALLGSIDLTDFVAAAILAETGASATTPSDRLQLPVGWTAGLEGLDGYDAQTCMLRITRNRDLLRDAGEDSLAFLGRAHPLVRRAIARVRRSEGVGTGNARDGRVSVARRDSGSPLAVLLSYSVEIGSPRRIELRRIIAVLLQVSGPPEEMIEPERWLSLGAPDQSVPIGGQWEDQFVSWVPRRMASARKIASARMERMTADFAAAQCYRAEHDAAGLQRWLQLRADDICGVHLPRTADLFGDMPAVPAWKALSEPLDRLAAFAADAEKPSAARREANSAVALFKRRSEERKLAIALSPPQLRPIGMLLLVPDGSVA